MSEEAWIVFIENIKFLPHTFLLTAIPRTKHVVSRDQDKPTNRQISNFTFP